LISPFVPFIREFISKADAELPYEAAREAITREFEDLLGDGPFLCGHTAPSLADLSAYPQITRPNYARGEDFMINSDRVLAWMDRSPPAEELPVRQRPLRQGKRPLTRDGEDVGPKQLQSSTSAGEATFERAPAGTGEHQLE